MKEPLVEAGGSRSREFLHGLRDQLPILLGVIPFGLIFGALARGAGIPALETQAFSILIFAGSSQFIAAGLVAEATPALVVVLTILLVNLRHMLYSATLAPHLSRLPLRWKIALAWLLTDEAFAMASVRYQRPDRGYPHWYFLGTGLTLWAAWQVSTFLGITLGSILPGTALLDFALPLTFLALLIPSLTDQPTLVVALSAGGLAVILAALPYKLGLMIAVLVSVGLGVWLEGQREQTRQEGSAR
jgi:4-azaleucine resistance transporter AzlC